MKLLLGNDKKLMLERKEPLSWLKSIGAFVNTSGGVLLYGVDNDGNLVGLENAERDAEDISEMVKCLMDPVPEFTLSLHEEDGRLVRHVPAHGSLRDSCSFE